MKRIIFFAATILLSLSAIAQNQYFYLDDDCSSNLENGTKSYVLKFPGQSKDSLFRTFTRAACAHRISSYERLETVNDEILIVDVFKPMSLYHGDAVSKLVYGVVYTVKFQFRDGAVRVFAPGIKCLLLGENANYNPQSFVHVQEIVSKGKTGKSKNLQREYDSINENMNSCVQEIVSLVVDINKW